MKKLSNNNKMNKNSSKNIQSNTTDANVLDDKKRRSQSGNVFFTLFGAVAVVGVLGAGIMSTMRGPLSTMVEINRIEEAKSEIRLNLRLILAESTRNPVPDSTDDPLTEPTPPITGGTCSITTGTGFGCMPTVGGETTDPWGTPYRYCAWNLGDDNDSEGNWLAGSTDTNNIAIVLISAGPDRAFQTTCEDDNAGVNDYVEPDGGGGDDIVQAMDYIEAVATSGGLWEVNTSVATLADSTVTEVDLSGPTLGSSIALRLGAASMILPDETELTNSACTSSAANDGLVRINKSGTYKIEVCQNPTGFIPAGSIWTDDTNGITYSAGNVGIGGASSATDALAVSGSTTLGGNLTVSGANTTTLEGATTVDDTLTVTGNLTVGTAPNAFTVAGASGNTDIDGTLNVDSTSVFNGTVTINETTGNALVINSDDLVVTGGGNVQIGAASSGDELEVDGDIDITSMYMMDGAAVVSDGGSPTGTILLGKNAGANVTGNNNTIVGDGASPTLTTGTGNIIIGQAADTPLATTSDYINIGDTITGTLGSSGDIDIANDLSVGNNLDVTETATIKTIDVVSGDIETLTISGSGDALTVTNNVDINGDIDVDGTLEADEITWNGNDFTPPTCNSTAGSEEYIYWDGDSWECRADSNDGSGGTGGTTLEFVDLDDTPNNYAGSAGDALKLVRVDSAGNDLEFVDPSAVFATSKPDKIEDVDGDTSIDVDISDDGATDSIIFAKGNSTDNTATEVFRITGNDGALEANNMTFDFKNTNSTGSNRVTFSHTGGQLWGSFGYNGVNMVLNASTGKQLVFQTNGANDRAIIDADGDMGIGTGLTVEATALFELASTTKGFLTPRMTLAERDAISSPATGLIVFATNGGDAGILQFYDGTNWVDVGGGGAEGGGLWEPDGTNDYIEYDDTLGGVRIGRVTGQPAPATDWQLDVANSAVYTTANKVAVGSSTVSLGLSVDVTGNVGATQYCDADGNNCFTAAGLAGGSGGKWQDGLNAQDIHYSLGDVGISTNDPLALLHVNGTPGTLDQGIVFGDGDSGLYETVDDTFAFNIQGTNRVTLDSNGITIGFGVSPRMVGGLEGTPQFVPRNGDNDTGLGRPTGNVDDTLALFTAGSERLFLDAAGRVAVGTSSPDDSAIFQIDSGDKGILPPRNADPSTNITSPATGLIVYNTDVGVNALQFYDGSAWVTLQGAAGSAASLEDSDGDTKIEVDTAGDGSDDRTVFTNDNAETMRITTVGDVGIGTTTPANKLHVAGSARLDDSLILGLTSGDAPTFISPTISGGTVTSADITSDSLDWDVFTDSMTLDSTTTIDMDTNSADLNFDSNTLFIDSSNNRVGIGMASPTYLIDIEHPDGVWEGIRVGKTGESGASLLLRHFGGSNSGSQIIQQGNLPLSFSTNSMERIRITGDGNVGIGKTDPGSLLTLLGGTFSLRETDDGNEAVGIGSGTQTGYITMRNDGTENVIIRSAVTGQTLFNAGPVIFGGSVSDVSARVQIDSTTQGFLAPRMTNTERDLIATPATSLLIFSITDNEYQFNSGTPGAPVWVPMSGSVCSDPTPDAFNLSNLANQTTSTVVASSIEQINGINCAVTVSVDGDATAQVQSCSDAACSTVVQGWTSSLQINNGEYLQTRLTTSAVAGTTSSIEITVGSATDNWTVTTAGGDCTVVSPTPGTVCADDTIYAGDTPDGNVKMYTTRCDAGQTWSGTACTGTRLSVSWATDNTINNTFADSNTGFANTYGIDALVNADAPYNAADYCANLNQDGHTDWYLPARTEIQVIESNYVAIGGFTTGEYWTSTESAVSSANIINIYVGSAYSRNKTANGKIRCARKDGASPPATTPGGSDGQVQYNDGGALGGDISFVWDDTNDRLGIGTASIEGNIHIHESTTTEDVVFAMTSVDTGSTSSDGFRITVGPTGYTEFKVLESIGMSFQTNGIQGIRLDQNGDILVGTGTPDASAQFEIVSTDQGFLPPRLTNTAAVTSPAKGLVIYDSSDDKLKFNAGDGATPNWVAMDGSTSSGSDTQVLFNNSGVTSGSASLTWDGSTFVVDGDIEYSGILTDTSDRRLKTDITPLETGDIVDRLASVDTYSFRMKDDPEGALEYGVMAQELETIFPELVKTADDEMGTKSVNYMGLIAPMIEATKALKEENETLKQELSSMKANQDKVLAALDTLSKDVDGLKVHTGYGIGQASMAAIGLLLSLLVMGGCFVMVRRSRSMHKTQS